MSIVYMKHGLSFLLFCNLVNSTSNLTSTFTFCSLAEQRQIALDKHNGRCQGSESWGKDVPERGNSTCEHTGFEGRACVNPGGMFGVAGVWHEKEETLGDKVGILLRVRLGELLCSCNFSPFRQLESTFKQGMTCHIGLSEMEFWLHSTRILWTNCVSSNI